MAWNMGLLGAAFSPVAAGAYDLLETVTLTSTTSSVTFDNLDTLYSSAYKHLEIKMVGRSTRTGANQDSFQMTFNEDNGANYTRQDIGTDGASGYGRSRANQSRMYLGQTSASDSESFSFGATIAQIIDPFSSNKNTTILGFNGSHAPGTGGGPGTYVYIVGGMQMSVNVLSSIQVYCGSNAFVAGSRFSIYGITEA